MAIYYGDGSHTNTGRVVQVIHTIRTSTLSEQVANGGIGSVLCPTTITPKDNTNKILVRAMVTMSLSTSHGRAASLTRDGSPICIGDAASNRIRRTSGSGHATTTGHTNIFMEYLDDPQTTSSIIYGFAMGHNENNTLWTYLNRTENDGDGTHVSRSASTVTVMEIAV